MKELGRLALEGVADELEDPSDHEKGEGDDPEAMDEDAGHGRGERDENQRDAEGVAEAVDGMLMTGRVLGDPFLTGALAEHDGDDTTDRAEAKARSCPSAGTHFEPLP